MLETEEVRGDGSARAGVELRGPAWAAARRGLREWGRGARGGPSGRAVSSPGPGPRGGRDTRGGPACGSEGALGLASGPACARLGPGADSACCNGEPRPAPARCPATARASPASGVRRRDVRARPRPAPAPRGRGVGRLFAWPSRAFRLAVARRGERPSSN